MSHDISENEKNVLDIPFHVLDKGQIRLIDYCGTDKRIVQAARVSYGEGTKTVREDKGLINYLIRNSHLSPFEIVNFTFHVKAPIFVAREWFRHRTGKYNEISGRYSKLKFECYVPKKKRLAKQSKDNKQGSGESFSPDIASDIITGLENVQQTIFGQYDSLINMDLAKELARINLPLSTYTEWYWNIDLRNLMNFLKLRMDPHAQYEIREYAQTIFEIIKYICPYTMESFKKYTLNGVIFLKNEIDALRILISGLNYTRVSNCLTEKEYKDFCKKINM